MLLHNTCFFFFSQKRSVQISVILVCTLIIIILLIQLSILTNLDNPPIAFATQLTLSFFKKEIVEINQFHVELLFSNV